MLTGTDDDQNHFPGLSRQGSAIHPAEPAKSEDRRDGEPERQRCRQAEMRCCAAGLGSRCDLTMLTKSRLPPQPGACSRPYGRAGRGHLKREDRSLQMPTTRYRWFANTEAKTPASGGRDRPSRDRPDLAGVGQGQGAGWPWPKGLPLSESARPGCASESPMGRHRGGRMTGRPGSQ
jgi:hypothetical protein